MFSRTARVLATVLVATAVVLSMAVGPAVATPDDGGLLGGDSSDDSTLGGDSGVDIGTDGVSVGGDSGVNVGTDGVSVGGDQGINASTDGVTVVGQDVGDGSSPSLGGDDGPIGTDGSNLEVGGDEGVSVGTDGVSAGGESGVSVGTDGVSVAGQDVGGEGLPGGDSLPGLDGVPGSDSGSVGEVPTGPLPVDVAFEGSGVMNRYVTISSAESSPVGVDGMLVSAQKDDGAMDMVSRLEVSGANRTYFDIDGRSLVSENGLEKADGAIYTVNESGGTYILALSRDNVQAAGTAVAQGKQVGVINAQNDPGTQNGTLAGGLNPANAPGPSLPVGPEMPERLGGGINCNGEECQVGTAGIYEQIPDNQFTQTLRNNYPFPQTIDQSGVVAPCNKPVGPDDLPTEQLPGLSDLPKGTLPGVPTSLLTNDAVLGLAFGATPAPCEVTQPVLDPVANPANEPGQASPTFDVGDGAMSTDNGFSAVRFFEVGPGGNLGTADGVYAVVLNEDKQDAVYEMDISNSEYQYVLIDTRGTREGNVTSGELETSLREDYLGLATDFENGPGQGEFSGGVAPSVVQKQIIKLELQCDASGCQPSYSGLPSLGALPELPNPIAGGAGLPA